MSLSGTTTRKAAATSKPRRVDLKALLAQLDSEWQQDKHEASGVAAYYHCCVAVALHWVRGDPYNYPFPESYQGERLAKMCAWLRAQQGKPLSELEGLREQQARLLAQKWPAYAQRCTTLGDNSDQGVQGEILNFTWDGLDSLWMDEQAKPDSTDYLPQFACKESEEFHLICLALLFLNRATKRRLADLTAKDVN